MRSSKPILLVEDDKVDAMTVNKELKCLYGVHAIKQGVCI